MLGGGVGLTQDAPPVRARWRHCAFGTGLAAINRQELHLQDGAVFPGILNDANFS